MHRHQMEVYYHKYLSSCTSLKAMVNVPERPETKHENSCYNDRRAVFTGLV